LCSATTYSSFHLRIYLWFMPLIDVLEYMLFKQALFLLSLLVDFHCISSIFRDFVRAVGAAKSVLTRNFCIS
jgi:hypothetical protein